MNTITAHTRRQSKQSNLSSHATARCTRVQCALLEGAPSSVFRSSEAESPIAVLAISGVFTVGLGAFAAPFLLLHARNLWEGTTTKLRWRARRKAREAAEEAAAASSSTASSTASKPKNT